MRYIKQLAWSIIPERYTPMVDRIYITLRYSGLRYKCPCCGGHFRELFPFGVKPRSNAQCPRCGSIERHRLLWLYLKNRTNFFKENLRVLDIAPMEFFQKKCKSLSNIEYVSGDISSPLAMVRLDVTKIPFPDNHFDCIICYHVFEHIPDDRKAMSELYRVLKPGGWAILQSPIDTERNETFEDPDVVLPKDRLRIFDQEDHLRIYGRDYKDRLEESGFVVRVDDCVQKLGDNAIRKFCLDRNEDIYLCSKPK